MPRRCAIPGDDCAGGPLLDAGTIRRQAWLNVALMALAWLMDAPALLAVLVPGLDRVADRLAPCRTAFLAESG